MYFNYYFNYTSIKPAVVDGGDEIILVDWVNKKSFECASNNDTPMKKPDYLYNLVNGSILCNFGLEAEDSFHLDSLAVCSVSLTQCKVCFTVNLTFGHYFDNWTDCVMPTINLDVTEDEQILL